jgi:hypothetical protein
MGEIGVLKHTPWPLQLEFRGVIALFHPSLHNSDVTIYMCSVYNIPLNSRDITLHRDVEYISSCSVVKIFTKQVKFQIKVVSLMKNIFYIV